MIKKTLCAAGIFFMSVINGYPYTVFLTETSRGTYENGVYVQQSAGEFIFEFEIDEVQGLVYTSKVTMRETGEIVDWPVRYRISLIEDGTSYAGRFMPSEGRRKEKNIILIGSEGTRAAELIIVGEDFFEYCKARSGRFYVSSGTAERRTEQ